jgi:hypothetical protein
MPFAPGHKKIAGRQKGTPNKTSSVVADILQARNINIVDEALNLYEQSTDIEFKSKILSLLFPYVYPKRVDALPDDALDITPDNEIDYAKETIKYLAQKFPELMPKNE